MEEECKFICIAYRKGKVFDVTIKTYEISTKGYKLRMEEQGFEVEVLTYIPPKFLQKETNLNSGDDGALAIKGGPWKIPIKCVELNKIYDCIKSCSKDLEIGVFRINRVLDTFMDVEGLHFVRIVDEQKK